MTVITFEELTEVPVKDSEITFSGTRRGMTSAQLRIVRFIVAKGPGKARHGDCKGSDSEFHDICLEFGMRHDQIFIHPGTTLRWRAFRTEGSIYPPQQNLSRNKVMVRLGDWLLATPGEEEMTVRGGTWSTIRYAHELGRRRMVIFPSGKVDYTQ